MSWTELLTREIEAHYAPTERLIDMVEDDTLNWKPSTGGNWMTVGQLLKHLGESCGAPMRGFVTGDWGMPEGVDRGELTMEEMLPPAEKLPTIDSVAAAKELLAEDRRLALEMVGQAGEERLTHDTAQAPWDSRDMLLGHRMLQMVEHLASHKSQLFYYLKLQGKPVHTGHLWGM